MSGALVLGVDSGGSGLRVALARADRTAEAATAVSRTPVRTSAAGIDAADMMDQLLPLVRSLLPEPGTPVDAVAVGAAGMATLGDDLRAALPDAMKRELGVGRIALAGDAVTAYAGALGQRPGAVVAAGTGMIALGSDLTGWRRADGWGHLLGDCGGGAWIGAAGLDAALRAFDGRRGGSAALLALAEERFGPAGELPGRIYPRTDRAAALASFAPDVARCATDGDPVAVDVLRRAARHIAESAAAVCPADGGDVALTGGLFRMGEPLLAPLRAEIAEQLPGATLASAAGDPLHGSLVIAAALATDGLRLPRDGRLLAVV
ncbi:MULTISPECIES: BadF/BadG/BcrA/BcrD ATPase family protein [unclassified Streptomyces]|uniref:N-acetylglucosamine kinase n=1 Tax=unclassified Streptomyces TaxID=2593676 RepID=UPI000DB9CE96|nr:BadF/BadG/BcrA/BcrD ATPase family protein [Streptomyces sp. PsTaAH-137]MYT75345.1 ATPase [Streptomyces sp. SID8367]RAJ86747.1 N-acetylglucosamine kinase-like BadF-type ATPase [Streptomyces sp. PsTaAH-137]